MPQKRPRYLFRCNLSKHYRILIISGRNVTYKQATKICFWDTLYKQELSSCWDGRPCQSKVGRKVGAAVPLSVGGAGFSSNTMSPGTRPISVPSGILIHQTVWPQYTNVTDRQRQDIGTIAYKRSPQNSLFVHQSVYVRYLLTYQLSCRSCSEVQYIMSSALSSVPIWDYEYLNKF